MGSAARPASPLRLRLGVALILLWWFPFWAFAPAIAHALGESGVTVSVAVVTTVIVVIQTIIGVLGLVVAGAEVKSIVKGRTKRQALAAVWYIFLHGKIDPRNPSNESGR